MARPLQGKVAVVTGATRGCGRGIAVELGAAGATVYATGRTTRDTASPMKRTETIDETAELVDAAGGTGVAVRCDFTSVSDVDALRDRIAADHGRVDVLVDDVWGGDQFVEFDTDFWASDLDKALGVVRNGLETHLIALHRLLPLVVARPGGLVIEVTDGDDDEYHYPGVGIPYFLVKSGVRAIGRVLGKELAAHGATGLTVTPGFLRSEMMLEHFGVTEDNWRDGTAKDPNYVMAESPHYIGRAIAALAADPEVSRFAGRTMASWTLMREYGFTDLDGSRPDWGRWFDEVVKPGLDPTAVDASRYR
ncbi:3-oxoacyl-[acyl-carrier protein] reductase [Actinokineospora spheciospongiae]|uniref:3-oxoacyl-[acyl-carrier protein] reductase n=1 Tax=Actinokineospora spheciospongiae TaxID=909613 RepID=W7INW5_9PSEU|nr:SDR family oxidoreductase [Actinokineospora spheciospongiae]EWC58447.1 3-oxoacyl-[acyl-carrier protein] reductase [Actinokineospora spheciospongiae]PWW61878.1 NAD(P)-dependent dehydrogenase (short-subunit alcohol dehydrogenase family) [Actinokineospora spheciospongiae]